MQKFSSYVLSGLLVASVLTPALSFGDDRTIHLEIQPQGDNTADVHVGGDGTYSVVLAEVLALRNDTTRTNDQIVAFITANRDSLPPPYYLEAVRRTCVSAPDAALAWLTLYSIRARYDAMRCTDATAIDNVQATIGWVNFRECASHLPAGQASFNASLAKTLAEPDLFQSAASPWWICSGGSSLLNKLSSDVPEGASQGPQVTVADADWLRPESDWPAIQQNLTDLVKKALAQ